ncbi:hypothetical protein N0V95_009899 [Ascochyta clinopodiicola]|nr:hypothetical protein N0V95_009899 [Ascochyta clinopodiicola]
MQSSHAASGIQPQHGGQMQSQMDPQAFAQAMSFMSTPAGMQSMNAFANHMSSTTNGVPQYPQSSPVQPVQVAPRFSPGQQAGQKRKRPEHGSNAPPLPQKKPQAGPKPPRAKAAAPPPVPSFGFSLPAPLAQSTADAKHDQRKRKMNLGLSEQNVMEESSEEEEVDEEAAFAEKVKIEGVAFEHNGEMISLQTAADVQSYIKDRRRNFPTRQRAAEKAQEAAAKREHELEFLHRVQGKPRKVATADAPPRPAKPVRQVKEVDKRKQEELAALRKRLHESMTNKQRPPPTNLLGLGYESETDSNAESSVLSDSSVVSSSEESEPGSDEEDSDSDAPPEPTSSKAAPPPVAVPPPAPVAAPPSQVCRNWSKDGRCKFGKGCRWAHPPQDKGSGKSQGTKKMGLFEKMVEQELEKADRLALDAIKYLGQNGFLG